MHLKKHLYSTTSNFGKKSIDLETTRVDVEQDDEPDDEPDNGPGDGLDIGPK